MNSNKSSPTWRAYVANSRKHKNDCKAKCCCACKSFTTFTFSQRFCFCWISWVPREFKYRRISIQFNRFKNSFYIQLQAFMQYLPRETTILCTTVMFFFYFQSNTGQYCVVLRRNMTQSGPVADRIIREIKQQCPFNLYLNDFTSELPRHSRWLGLFVVRVGKLKRSN